MELKFGKYTDITNFAKKVNPYMFKVYEKIYICPDTNNYWLSTIQKDINEDYEKSPGTYLVERDDVDYPDYDGRFDESNVKEALENWDGSTYDNYEAESLEDAIDLIDDGYGIIPESGITNSRRTIKSSITQRELKDMIRRGQAIDITYDENSLPEGVRLDVLQISKGTYGMNGALFKGSDGNLYAIAGRTSNLFRWV